MADNFNPQADKQYAAGQCAANCSHCNGNCAQQAQHNGPHQCDSGHSW